MILPFSKISVYLLIFWGGGILGALAIYMNLDDFSLLADTKECFNDWTG